MGMDGGGRAGAVVVSRLGRCQARAVLVQRGQLPKACSRRLSAASPRADEEARFQTCLGLICMMSAPLSSPLSMVSVWYQFECISIVL